MLTENSADIGNIVDFELDSRKTWLGFILFDVR